MGQMMKKSGTPWVDKSEIVKDIKEFIKKSGSFFRQNEARMSDFFEMAAYNSIVLYYSQKGYNVVPTNLRKGVFRYKLSPSGVFEKFSYFVAQIEGKRDIEIHHNIKVASAHEDHIYYTPDISICREQSVKTQKQNNSKRHSYIPRDKLISFFETKNHTPFPELLFNFSGLVLELMPSLINGNENKSCIIKETNYRCKKGHLAPGIIVSGILTEYTTRIKKSLMKRYNYNIFTGTCKHKGKVSSFLDFYQRCRNNTECPCMEA